MKLAKHINTIVCDDIRQESNDKLSLMGIYQKDIVVNNTPFILPTLCFMFTLEGVKTDLSGLKIEINYTKFDKNSNADKYAYLMRKDSKNKMDTYVEISLEDIEKFLKK